ncbi:ACT domain-containing protein [Globomyces pollinis-pini]|nr:ACT domain-containing protein [Globomyces pollinis-pini]
MILNILPEIYLVLQLPTDFSFTKFSKNFVNQPFFSLTRTNDEISIICSESSFNEESKTVTDLSLAKQEVNWKILKVDGVLDFSLVGIMAKICDPLAKASISVFVISTFNTDYVMVKANQIENATKALEAAGFVVKVSSN